MCTYVHINMYCHKNVKIYPMDWIYPLCNSSHGIAVIIYITKDKSPYGDADFKSLKKVMEILLDFYHDNYYYVKNKIL